MTENTDEVHPRYIETTIAELPDVVLSVRRRNEWPMKVRLGRFIPSRAVPGAGSRATVPADDFIIAPDTVQRWWFGPNSPGCLIKVLDTPGE